MFLDKMVNFLWDEFDVLVSISSISRALASIGWSKKTARRVAKQRNVDLRDFYLYRLSAFEAHHVLDGVRRVPRWVCRHGRAW
jgi:hypothetical protein